MDTNATTIKVMVVDDHTIFRNGVKNALRDNPDIRIIAEAENGEQLLNLLQHITPDIIILNITMPVMDGITALPIIRKHYPGIKVIILSMNNDPRLICRMLEMGASTYLTKEAGGNQINEAVLACHKQWFYINDTVKNAIAAAGLSPDIVLENEKAEKNHFSITEIKLLQLLMADTSTDELATKIDLSRRTVDAIIEKLKIKAGVNSKAGLQLFAQKNLFNLKEDNHSQKQ